MMDDFLCILLLFDFTFFDFDDGFVIICNILFIVVCLFGTGLFLVGENKEKFYLKFFIPNDNHLVTNTSIEQIKIMPSTHNKDKPWDTEDIDKWKEDPFGPDDLKCGEPFLEESSFATLFPKYREGYLRGIWADVTEALKKKGIACILDLVEGSMIVKTTVKSYDPAAILKARDLIKLLARSVPFGQAVKILEDDIACDVIKVSSFVTNKDRFVKRRQRLLGPDGKTLKALELLTKCYILVQGNTVAVMGPYKGLKECRRIVEDCMKNVHPIYHIKELMIKRELAKNPDLADEDWNRFLPQFRKRNVARKKPMSKTKEIEQIQMVKKVVDGKEVEVEETVKITVEKKSQKKVYTPFPPAQTQSKVDIQLETGEYFWSKREKEAKKLEEKREKREAAKEEKQKEREKDFVAPKEKSYESKIKNKKSKKSSDDEEKPRKKSKKA